MFTLNELKRTALKEGVPQAIVEKDYALSVALKAIAGSQAAPRLVFKGGTAIRKIYFENARFSEDIDFNSIGLGGLIGDYYSDSPYAALKEAGLASEADEAYMRSTGPRPKNKAVS